MDHSILSPSGKVSKRAERAAKERVRQELFGEGLEYPFTIQPTDREHELRLASEYRELAARGMSPRKYLKLAETIEKKYL